MTLLPSSRAARMCRRSSGTALGVLGVLLLAGCGPTPAEQGGSTAAEPGTSNGGVQQQVPEPSGNQLSHEDMREQLASRYPDAALTDTADYWAGLRDIETELQRLVVDPPECKQFVVRSAVPVPAGALVAFADTAGAAEDGDSASEGDGAGEAEDGGGEADPEAGAVDTGARIQLANTGDDDAETQDEDQNGEDDGEGSGDGDGSGDGSGDGNGSEQEPEPVTVDLPAERDAVIYTFRDWRAADAHFSAEEDGLESCDAYTASRSGGDSAETSTSVDTVDLESDADAALGTTRRISSEGEREHSAAATLRTGSHIVTVAVPLTDSLSEDEAEVAVAELEAEAMDLLEALD